MHSRVHLAWATLACLSAVQVGRAQVEWSNAWIVQDRANQAMAYDSARDRIVLFGGRTRTTYLSDTWEWDGTGWKQLSPTTSPPARDAHAMAYDSARDRIVLFGGRDATGARLADTWEWDGSDWTLRTPAQSPGATVGHCMTYDALRGETVLAARDFASGVYRLWEWNGTRWRLAVALLPTSEIAYDSTRQVTVILGVDPYNGFNATWTWDGTSLIRVTPYFGQPRPEPMVEDASRGRLVSFDGPRGQTWEWDGRAWTLLWPATNPAAQQIGYALAPDQRRGRTLLMGGVNQHGEPVFDTWEWDGVDWKRRVPFPSPSGRQAPALSYDASRDRAVLFGGFSGSTSLGDTWEWDGSQWRDQTPAASPPARSHSVLATMSSGRTLLFGGIGGFTELSDTWDWDGSTWTERFPAAHPPARWGHVATYDSRRDRVVLFGGIGTSGSNLADTWEWDGAGWMQRFPDHSPTARNGHTLAYDVERKVVVLFGGWCSSAGACNDTWEWDGNDWVQRFPSVAPPVRAEHAMAYDVARRRVVVFGSGSIFPSDVWEWDGVNWMNRTTSNHPPARDDAPMVYDAARGQMLLFGGQATSGAQFLADTWTYAPVHPASYAPFGSGCTGTSGIPSLSAPPSEYPWLGTTLHVEVSNLPPAQPLTLTLGSSKTSWGPLTLPAQLGFLGMTGCAMYASGESVIPLANVGGSATWTLNVPNDPSIVTARFYNQAYVFDPGANPFGLTVSNAGEGIVGSK